jgi:hypothetical protein
MDADLVPMPTRREFLGAATGFAALAAKPFLGGYGNPTRKVGLIHSMFRPSDDACLLPFFIPGNLFAVVSLRKIATMANAIAHDSTLANDADGLSREVETAAHLFGVIRNRGSNVWAYEGDGYGTQLFMDDANAPNLISLAYLGVCDHDNLLYRRTRAAVWSARNPYFFHGAAGEGIGSPHSGLKMIWPMSQLLRALTSRDDAEIAGCLRAIKATHGGTGSSTNPSIRTIRPATHAVGLPGRTRCSVSWSCGLHKASPHSCETFDGHRCTFLRRQSIRRAPARIVRIGAPPGSNHGPG